MKILFIITTLLSLSTNAADLRCRMIAVKSFNGGLFESLSYDKENRPSIDIKEDLDKSTDEYSVFSASYKENEKEKREEVYIQKDEDGECLHVSSIVKDGGEKEEVARVSCTKVLEGDATYGLGNLKGQHRFLQIYGVRFFSSQMDTSFKVSESEDPCLQLIKEDVEEDQLMEIYDTVIDQALANLPALPLKR